MNTIEKCGKDNWTTGIAENQQQFFIQPLVDYWNNIYPVVLVLVPMNHIQNSNNDVEGFLSLI